MQQIADWLEKLGLSEYAQRFAENDIDLSVLPHLTDQDLKELGVSLGHRRKILAAIATGPPSLQPVLTDPKPQDTAERRHLTVMICDLVGSEMCIRDRCLIVSTRGGNRMRESCKYGSVRGARGNSRPYRACDGASSSRYSAARQHGRSRRARSSRRCRWLDFSSTGHRMFTRSRWRRSGRRINIARTELVGAVSEEI